MQKDLLESIMDKVTKTVTTSKRPGKTLSDVKIKDYQDVIPFGNYDLDTGILTVGGICKGRITEISGEEASAKSTLAYRAISSCQELPSNIKDEMGVAVFFDAEQAASDKAGVEWIKKHGVNIDRLIYHDDIIAEDILQKALEYCKMKVDLIVIDSVVAMTAREDSLEANAKKKMFKPSMATLARVMSSTLNQLNQAAREGNTAIIFINQLREKPGVMFGDPTTTPGGRALKYYASQRLKIAKKSIIMDGNTIEGILVHAFLKKSKVSPPLRKTGVHTVGFIPIYFDGRIVDDFDSILLSAIELDIIHKEKRTYTFKDLKVSGKPKLKEAILPYKE
jgi:recombination protein RecA